MFVCFLWINKRSLNRGDLTLCHLGLFASFSLKTSPTEMSETLTSAVQMYQRMPAGWIHPGFMENSLSSAVKPREFYYSWGLIRSYCKYKYALRWEIVLSHWKPSSWSVPGEQKWPVTLLPPLAAQRSSDCVLPTHRPPMVPSQALCRSCITALISI